MKESTAEEIVKEIEEIVENSKEYLIFKKILCKLLPNNKIDESIKTLCKLLDNNKMNESIKTLLKDSSKEKQDFIKKHINIKINCFAEKLQKSVFFWMVFVALNILIMTIGVNATFMLITMPNISMALGILASLYILRILILLIINAFCILYYTYSTLKYETAYEKILLALENHRFNEIMEKKQ